MEKMLTYLIGSSCYADINYINHSHQECGSGAPKVDSPRQECSFSAKKVDSSRQECGFSAKKVDSLPRQCTYKPPAMGQVKNKRRP